MTLSLDFLTTWFPLAALLSGGAHVLLLRRAASTRSRALLAAGLVTGLALAGSLYLSALGVAEKGSRLRSESRDVDLIGTADWGFFAVLLALVYIPLIILAVRPRSERNQPAGWYADGLNAGRQRYWDGAAWTDQTGPDGPESAPWG